MKVQEIMTSDPACCTPDTPLSEVATMMVNSDCGEIPVVQDRVSKKPVGVVTDRDIVVRTVARGQNPADMRAGDVMSRPVVTVHPDMRVEDCCRILEERQVRRAPVTDDRGECCGIVSVADIAQTAPKKLTAEVVRTVSQRMEFEGPEDQRAL